MMSSSSKLFLKDNQFYYFNIMYGFGSNIECSYKKNIQLCPNENYQIFCSKFCWLWLNKGLWLFVDEVLSNYHSNMAQEASILWFTSSFILIFCAALSLLGTLFFILSARISDNERILMRQYLSL